MAKREFTCGSFILNTRSQLLVLHPTGAKHDFWSIPKGRAEAGESYKEAAERELFEETGLKPYDITTSLLVPVLELPPESYTKRRKTLIPFYYQVNDNLNEFPFHCDIKPDDNGKSEADAFAWVGLDKAKKILHYTQVRVVQTIEKMIKEANFILN
jgi:8-oxo-dGTP pyrophosphatase MutT (NUDIX family)